MDTCCVSGTGVPNRSLTIVQAIVGGVVSKAACILFSCISRGRSQEIRRVHVQKGTDIAVPTACMPLATADHRSSDLGVFMDSSSYGVFVAVRMQISDRRGAIPDS